MTRPPVAVTFGPAGAQLFGLHHAPDPAIARATGVVLCNPLGYEVMCSHRAYRCLAERLAATGFHVLRFDYQGTGDSSGDGAEPDRLRAWLDSVGAAIDELRAVSGVRAVSLFGVRFGATLAALAAAERRDVEGLALWAPCVSGRAYARELRAFRMIDDRARPRAPREGDHDVAGYPFTQATMLELSAIDLLAPRERIALRALVLPRDDLPGKEAELAAVLESTGVETRLRPGPGYASMMSDPEKTIIPLATLDEIVDWAAASGEPRASGAADRGVPSSVLITSSRESGRPVREEALRFGDGDRLFGVLTEPAATIDVPGRPAVLFLNVGKNHHIGPNRMYVTLARDLAALGYLGFRFDVAGIGDSAAPEGDRDRSLYSQDSVSDVRTAVSLLTRIRGVERVILVGLCSGAYLAFHAALTDPRVAGQILINAQTLEQRDGHRREVSTRPRYKSTRYYKRELLRPAAWGPATRGDVDLRGIAGVLGDRLVTRALAGLEEATARWRGQPVRRTRVERSFVALSDRGVESLLVFSSTDGGLDMIEEHLGRDASRVKDRENIRLAIVEGADHTFSHAAHRSSLHALVARFVEGAFPSPARSRV